MIIPSENFAHLYHTSKHVRIVWPLCEEQTHFAMASLKPKAYADDPDLIFAEPMNKTRHRGLGQAAPNPLLCVVKYFPDELTKPLGHW